MKGRLGDKKLILRLLLIVFLVLLVFNWKEAYGFIDGFTSAFKTLKSK
jgi:hypothetical protein